MKVAYFDCFSGVAGDMILGALVDLGVNIDFLKKEIKKLDIYGYNIDVKKVKKNKILATDIYITINEDVQHHRSFKDIKGIIDDSSLDNNVKELSKKIFYNLALAEGKVHKVNFEDVHFHEVGAVDSIIDIVGSAICLKKLDIDQIFCSPLPLGSGSVKCAHGVISIPAPATLELIKDIPTYQSNADHEMVTPTGAAVVTTISKSFGEMPDILIEKTGYGAGKIKSKMPGILCINLGKMK